MDTQKIATEYRMAQWAKVMQRRIESGKLIKDFCQDEGISRNTYFYWQRKLRKTACSRLPKSNETAIVPNGWLQLKSKEPSNTGSKLVVEINSCHITVDTYTDTELLKKVCYALMSL